MSGYDWIIGIAVPIMIGIVFWFLDDDNTTGFTIIIFMNIGLVIMVYANLISFSILIVNFIFTILIIYLKLKSGVS